MRVFAADPPLALARTGPHRGRTPWKPAACQDQFGRTVSMRLPPLLFGQAAHRHGDSLIRSSILAVNSVLPEHLCSQESNFLFDLCLHAVPCKQQLGAGADQMYRHPSVPCRGALGRFETEG
ncbi:hypothetical protein E1301_Tti016913 [Triplophysa tibetana]|uniref:Uncharacterized protein n=1 Tax=Triplophysa tibetana TaxID=1572043 RepID=A0A5A9NLD4_9TELE|nr:hypothetical protein E1301_Tti016913 [Triplophysa tibetana]